VSYIRITEFADVPADRDGEWYLPEGRAGSVHLVRGDAALEAANEAAGQVALSWTGVRLHRWGSAKGSQVYMLAYPVPLDYLYEFDAWFRYEHMPMLLEEPTWYGCEFFRALGASCYAFAALHYLDPRALKSDARDRSIDTPWWHRLKQNDWFDRQFVRTIMKPL
jgi:hypothetical protein